MARSIKRRVTTSFGVAFAAILVAVGLISLLLGRWYVANHVSKDAFLVVNLFSTVLEENGMVSLDAPPGSAEYRSYRDSMRAFVRDNGYAYLSVYEYDESLAHITYRACVAADDEEDREVAVARAPGTVVTKRVSEAERQVLEEGSTSTPVVIQNEFGYDYLYCAKVELPGRRIIVGIEYSVPGLTRRITLVSLQVLAVFALVFVVLLAVELRTLDKRVFRPLHRISRRMGSFFATRGGPLEPLGIDSGDEMGEIAHSFEGMAAAIDSYVADIERMTEERTQASVELDVARHIQFGMVPEHGQLVVGGAEASALSRSAREVGGDFYDLIELDDTHLALVIGDVSSKGVAAALLMAMVKTMIRDGLLAGMGPAAVLAGVNDRLCAENPEGMFVTALIVVVDAADGEVCYANAGHMPALVVGGDVRATDMDPGLLVGLFDDAEFEEGRLRLCEGETLLLYTDGVTEAVDGNKTFLGMDRLTTSLGGGLPYRSARDVAEAVARCVDGFVGDNDQFDDLTVVALRRGEGPGGTDGMIGLPVSQSAITTARARLLALDVDAALARRACLVCEELVSNVIGHSGAQNLWFVAWVGEDGALRMSIADDGAAFDPTAAGVGEREFEELDQGGMGIGLALQLAASLSYRREGGRNVVSATLR